MHVDKFQVCHLLVRWHLRSPESAEPEGLDMFGNARIDTAVDAEAGKTLTQLKKVTFDDQITQDGQCTEHMSRYRRSLRQLLSCTSKFAQMLCHAACLEGKANGVFCSYCFDRSCELAATVADIINWQLNWHDAAGRSDVQEQVALSATHADDGASSAVTAAADRIDGDNGDDDDDKGDEHNSNVDVEVLSDATDDKTDDNSGDTLHRNGALFTG